MQTQQQAPRDPTQAPTQSMAPLNRILVTAGVIAGLIAFIGLYHKQNFVWLSDRHAMDIAQIARNIHSGKGFTTRFLRPFNVALIDPVEGMMPEVNSAPLYPYAVSAVIKAKRAWSDQCVAWVSLGFLCLTVIATYFLGRMVFGWRVGLLAAALVGTRAPALQAGTSGQEWTMAAFWFALLLLVIAKHHITLDSQSGLRRVVWPVAAAIITAILYMTNHLFVFLIVPLALYFAFSRSAGRIQLVLFLVCAVLACAPWAYRNADLTHGSVIGGDAWNLMANTNSYPGDNFARGTIGADRGVAGALWFPLEHFSSFAQKLVRGSSDLAGAATSMLGLAVLGFAVVSVLYRFKVPSANAMRGFTYVAIPVLVSVFALFSANKHCVVVFLPVAAVYASAYFFLLLDAKGLHVVYSRALIGGLLLVSAWPALGACIWSERPVVPQGTNDANNFFAQRGDAEGLVYTDVPWLAAMRSNCTAIWLPRTEDAADLLDTQGLPLTVVCLTSESGSYPRDEVWYLLHRWNLWRDYVRDPAKCIEQLATFVEAHNQEQMQAATVEGAVQKTKTNIRSWLRMIMGARARSCVIYRAAMGLQTDPVAPYSEMPAPDQNDTSQTPNDANAASPGIVILRSPEW